MKSLKTQRGKSKDRQHNDQKKKRQQQKQRPTKQFTENERSSNIKNQRWTRVLRKG